MSKEFEALERLYKCNDDDYTLGYQQHDYNLLKQALQHLEQIENSKPSEALKRLNGLDEHLKFIDIYYNKNGCGEDYEVIKQALLKAQEQEKENAELKEIMKIIVEKQFYSFCKLTQEERSLLKKWEEKCNKNLNC